MNVSETDAKHLRSNAFQKIPVRISSTNFKSLPIFLFILTHKPETN